MAHFRETMWFKLGDAEPQTETDGDETEPSATVMMLPIEDRYGGEVSSADSRTFGLHTGMTEAIRIATGESIDENADVWEDETSMKTLVREMKKKPRTWIAGTLVSIAALASALIVYA